jgi:hypothetical protein
MNRCYEQHHLGRLVPAMSQTDFERLCAAIRAQGLLEEIDLYEDKILDGWSRYQACLATGVQPRFRSFTGDNPVAYVLAKNVQRRHLSTVQILKVLEMAREPLAAEAVARQRANLKHQASPLDAQNSAPRGPVAEQLADMAHVSRATVQDYHAVQQYGSVELKQAVDREEVAISDAAEVARHQPPEQQSHAVKRVRAGAAATLREAIGQSEATTPSHDSVNRPIPECLTGAFAARAHFREAKQHLAQAKKLVTTILAGPAAALLAGTEGQAIARRLGELRAQLDAAEPYAVCPDCLGQGCRIEDEQGPSLCRGGGFISRRQHRKVAGTKR